MIILQHIFYINMAATRAIKVHREKQKTPVAMSTGCGKQGTGCVV
jgi:hypothetical protein